MLLQLGVDVDKRLNNGCGIGFGEELYLLVVKSFRVCMVCHCILAKGLDINGEWPIVVFHEFREVEEGMNELCWDIWGGYCVLDAAYKVLLLIRNIQNK